MEIEENEAQKVADNVKMIKDDCQWELDAALPDLKRAEDALKTIDQGQVAILKKMQNPVPQIKMVFAAVCVLFGDKAERKMNPQT